MQSITTGTINVDGALESKKLPCTQPTAAIVSFPYITVSQGSEP